MKKIIIIGCICLGINFSFSQYSVEYLLIANGAPQATDIRLEFDLNSAAGNVYTHWDLSGSMTLEERTSRFTTTYTGSYPTRITFASTSRTSFGGFCGGTKDDNIDLNAGDYFIFGGDIRGRLSCPDAFYDGAFWVRPIKDLVQPTGEDRIVCKKQSITLAPQNGPIIQQVFYQTSEPMSQPVAYATYDSDNYKPSVTIDLSTLPIPDSGISIDFWLVYPGQVAKSNEITYEVLACSPELDGPIEPIQPSCSNSINAIDNNNGSFTVTFDRELEEGEKMKIEVWDLQNEIWDGLDATSTPLSKNDFDNRSYTWSRNNLPGGTYKIFWQTKSGPNPNFDEANTVPDKFGESPSFDLTTPPELSVNGDPQPVRCFGGNDGSITVNVSENPQGTTPNPTYEYSIDDGMNWQTSSLFEGLEAEKNYIITIRNGNGCLVKSLPIEVGTTFTTIPDVTGLSGLIRNPTVINGNNGRIVITVSGGSDNYTNYAWTKDGNPFTPSPSSSNTSLNDLYEGTYTIVVTDSNGCSSEIETFTLVDPEPIDITINMTPDVLDCSYTQATLIASATGGHLDTNSDYTYQWDDDNGTTGNTLNNAEIGITYEVTVTDDGGNSLSESITITGPTPITVTPASNPVTCKNGETGSIELTITGGTPFDPIDNPEGYTVTWIKLFDNSFNQTGTTITNLSEGSYEYLITDKNECELNNFGDPIIITEPTIGVELFEVVASHIDNIIFEGAIGELEIDFINNQGTLSFEWFKDGNPFTRPAGSTNTKLINLEAGDYNVVVTDIDGCTATLENPIPITQPDLLAIESITPVNVSCKTFNDGTITVTTSGGIEPYTYDWKKIGAPDFIAIDDATIENLEPGQYTVTITDDSGSTAEVTSGTIDIIEPDTLEIITEGITKVICPGESTGVIDISVIGGTPPYTFVWDNGQTTEDIQNLAVATYTVTVEDSNGCTTETTLEVTDQGDQLQIQPTITNVSAYEGSDGSIAVQITGGIPPYTIQWTQLSDNTVIGNDNNINNLIAGMYHLSVTDSSPSNCLIEDTYEVTQPDVVEATITELVCTGDCDATIAVEVNKGNGSFTYQWNTGETTNTISNLCAGSYTVTIEGFGDKTLVRTYEITDPDPVTIDLGEDRFICLGQTTTISALIDDSNASYSWSANNGFTSDQPQITVNKGGVYTATITNHKGCIGSANITVQEVDAEIKAEFLYASQVFANEKMIIIDVTNPTPNEVEWIVPQEATIEIQNQDLIELSFDKPGEYEITLIATLGDCKDVYIQKVLVLQQEGLNNENDSTIQQLENIKEFKAYPNPSDGKFSVKVTLKEEKEISLKVFNLTDNTLLKHISTTGKKEYNIPFTLQVASGVYAIVLETPYGNAIRKVIVK